MNTSIFTGVILRYILRCLFPSAQSTSFSEGPRTPLKSIWIIRQWMGLKNTMWLNKANPLGYTVWLHLSKIPEMAKLCGDQKWALVAEGWGWEWELTVGSKTEPGWRLPSLQIMRKYELYIDNGCICWNVNQTSTKVCCEEDVCPHATSRPSAILVHSDSGANVRGKAECFR